MKKIISLILLNTSIIVYSQEQFKIDSLKIKLQEYKSEDSLYFEIKKNIVIEYISVLNKGELAEIEAKSLYNEAEKAQNQFGLLVGHYCKSLVFKFYGNYPYAIEECYKMLIITKNNNFKKYEGLAYYEIANNLRLSNKNEDALVNHLKALQIFEEISDKKQIAVINNNIGLIYNIFNKINKALWHYNKAIENYKKIDNIRGVAYVNENIAMALVKNGELEDAEKKIFEALNLTKTYGSNFQICQIYRNISKIKQLRSDFIGAEKYSMLSLKIAIDKNFDVEKVANYEELSKLSDKLNKPKQALYYMNEMLKIKAIIDKQDLEKKIKAAKLEYDISQQVELNRLQESEINTQKKLNIILILGSSIFAILAIYLVFINKKVKNQKIEIGKQKEQISKTNAELEELNNDLEFKVITRTNELSITNTKLIQKTKEAENALLEGQAFERSRIASELHDNLGGHISAIRWSMKAINFNNLTKSEEKIYSNILKMIDEAYNEVRYISHNLLPEEFSKLGLLNSLEKLFNNLNSNQNIIFEFRENINRKLSDKIEFELYCICLELINNILKHSNATRVDIDLIEKKEKLFLSIIDDGVELESIFNKTSEGKGLKSIQNRVVNNGGNFFVKSTPLKNNKSIQNLNQLKVEFPC